MKEKSESERMAAMEGIVRKVEPKATRGELALPAQTLAALQELSTQARMQGSGERKSAMPNSAGSGIAAFFAGPDKASKLMAAEALAQETQRTLYHVSTEQIASKYIGETEKNLALIFSKAADSNAILFFDEADALFGKRSEVKDSHDRYAALEPSALLQRCKAQGNIVILAAESLPAEASDIRSVIGSEVHFPLPGGSDT